MDKSFIKLYKQFEKIKEKGYIKGIYNSYSSIGRTFESELGLDMNKECVPDYEGIEIKTKRPYSKSLLSLFTAVPDGKEPLELSRIKELYGYPYKKDRRFKALYVEVYGNKLNYGGAKYQYKLDIDRVEKRIYLCIYDRHEKLIERRVYWSFEYLKSKLNKKLNKLAIVNAWTNKINNWNYFKYYKINFYTLKDFNTFINLLASGEIILKIKIDIYTDKANYGKMYDHGCSFSISKDNVEKLFTSYLIDIDKHI